MSDRMRPKEMVTSPSQPQEPEAPDEARISWQRSQNRNAPKITAPHWKKYGG